jgi:predicted ArsR family transcriptional regulator
MASEPATNRRRKNQERRQCIVDFITNKVEVTAQEVSEFLKTHVNQKSFLAKMEKEGLLVSELRQKKHPYYSGKITFKVFKLPADV